MHRAATPMDVLSAFFELLLIATLVTAVVAVYLLPTIVASKRRHRNRKTILVINLLLGWTTIGWIVAMVWAFTSDVEPPSQPIPPPAEELAQEQKRANKSQAGWLLACFGLIAAVAALIVFWR